MSNHYDIQILRSKLIAMTRLTQRTVDYAIKAVQLGRPELCRVVHNSRDEMNAMGCWIASHGQALLSAGTLGEADSRFVCAALRISRALEAAFKGAVEIVQQSETRFAAGWEPVSGALEDAGHFVNSLIRLCVLSLLKRDIRDARAVLHHDGAGQSLDLAVRLTHNHLTQRTSAQVRFELAITRWLDEIAGQTREIADAIILWLENNGRRNAAGVGKLTDHVESLTMDACKIRVKETDSPCKALFFAGAVPPRDAIGPNPLDDSIAYPAFAEAVPKEDFAEARLMVLQQRVCELLVKNQQLRMALIAERAESCHC